MWTAFRHLAAGVVVPGLARALGEVAARAVRMYVTRRRPYTGIVWRRRPYRREEARTTSTFPAAARAAAPSPWQPAPALREFRIHIVYVPEVLQSVTYVISY